MRCTCFLFGHSDAPDSIFPDLLEAVAGQLCSSEATDFIAGRYGNFDRMAARAVVQLKQQYPKATLTLLLAYPPSASYNIPDGFDCTIYPSLENVPHRFAIVHANRAMISRADSVICYVRHFGNSRNLLDYALRQSKKRPLHIVNLADGA